VARIQEPGAPGDRSDDSLRVQLIQPRQYPVARPKRVLGVKTAVDPTLEALMDTTGAIPRTRLFPWRVHETAARRNSFATPRLQGPVLVQSFSWKTGVVADPPNETIEIGYATTNPQETDALLTTPRPYTVLTELQDPQNIIANDRGLGFPVFTVSSPEMGSRIPLGLIITDPEVFVCVCVVNPSGSIQDFSGYLWLLEQVSRKALEMYVGAP